ncbi:ANTH-domain-containing protein [Agrocybe pediades]|nr:ANTH-domain-containing protein [Agrocybe pediades]
MSSFDKVVKLACKPKAAPPKAKYIDPIIAATWSDDGAVHDVCKALAPRIREPNAIVAFKALIVLHTMIRNGATDNVLSYLSSSEVLRLRNITAGNWDGYAAPQNLQNYALYLDSRIRAYKDLKHDAIRVQADTNRDMRNSQSIEEEGYRSRKDRAKTSASAPARSKTIMGRKLRSMTVEKGLLRETKAVHSMIDALVECRFYLDDLEDELTITALRMLVKDLLILFQAGNEGVINVLEHYFEMSHIDAEEALRIYRHFCKQTDYVVEYLGVAKKLQNLLNVSIPNLKHAPVSLAGALEEYLKDPNFEQNRLEYKANKEAADGVSKPSTSGQKNTPATNGNSASAPKVAFTSDNKGDASKGKDSNKDIIDFFSAIEPEQSTSSPNAVFAQQAPNPFAQMATGQPFMQQPPQIAFQPTGFIMPQQTAMPQQPNPFGNFLSPQAQVPQQTGHRPFSSYLQPQSTGFVQQSMQQPQPTGFLQPQATGVNPFRQSMLVPQTTGMALFGTSGPQNAQNQAQSHQLQNPQSNQSWMSQSSATSPGSFALSSSASAGPSPFAAPTPSFMAQSSGPNGTPARPASTPLASSTNSAASPIQLVKTHQTGTNNPFGPITTPAPPVPKPPTLFQLQQSITGLPNLNGNQIQPSSQNQVQQQQQQSAPQQQNQPTGFGGFSFNNSALNPGASDISSVASSFAFANSKSKANSSTATSTTTNGNPLTSQDTSTIATGSTFSPSLFSSTLSSQPTGTSNTSFSTQSSSNIPPPVKSHLTGFAGLKPFKPSSSFGASLLESLPPIPDSGPTTPAITGLPSTSSSTSPSAGAFSPTSNPSSSSHFSTNPNGNSNSSTNHSFLSSQPTGATGGFGGSSLGVGLRPQMTGGGAANPFRASMAAGQAFGNSSSIPPLPSMNFSTSQPFGAGMFGNQQQPQQTQQNSLI